MFFNLMEAREAGVDEGLNVDSDHSNTSIIHFYEPGVEGGE
jgi:hypothetical protein